MENQEITTNVITKEQKEKEKKDKLDKILKGVNEEGKTLTVVAKELGYSNSDSVGKILKRAGYKRKGKEYILIKEDTDKANNAPIDIDAMRKQIEDMSKRLKKLEQQDNEGILVSNEQMNYKSTSIRVDESILQAFDNLCEKYANVSKSYLISIALRDFVEKHEGTKKD